MDTATRAKIAGVLDKILTHPAVQPYLPLGNDVNVMFTTIQPNGNPVPVGRTGVGTLLNLADKTYGPGYVYDAGMGPENQVGISDYTHVLLVDPTIIDDGKELYTYTGTDVASLTRVLFHEVFHLIFEWNAAPNRFYFGEELSIFAENAIYNKVAGSFEEDDVFQRYGHAGEAWNGQGSSGLHAIASYINDADAQVGFDMTRSDTTKATYIATDGIYSLTKVLHNVGFEVGEFAYDHYIELTEVKSSGSYILPTANGIYKDDRISLLASDMMNRDLMSSLDIGINGWKAANSIAGLAFSPLVRMTGLGADVAIGVGLKPGVIPEGEDWEQIYQYVGATANGSTERPYWLTIDDAAASLSTILVGGGGAHGDILMAGSGNDMVIASGLVENILHGNGGDDILVGTDANDKLYGGAGNNILIGRGGQNHLEGGSNNTIAYYGDRSQGITVYDGLGRVEHDGVLDTFVGIKGFVGTKRNDVFVADGKGHTFYGNGGSDEFLAAAGGDTFRGVNGAISGTISFAALLTSGIEIGETGTNVGHVYDRPNLIIGSSQVDIIKLSSTSRIAVRGGGGNDDITVSKGNAYGEGGDDTFRVVAGINGSVIDGGIGTDKIVFESAYALNDYVSINWEDDTPGYSYKIGGGIVNGATLVSIEKFDFSKDGVAIKTHLRANIDNAITGTNRGNDEIIGGHLVDIIHAGGSSQSLSTGYHNILNGREGDDKLYGATNGDPNLQGDWLIGGSGNDKIYGSAGKDRIDGGYGSTDDDELHGGEGDDLFFDASGKNYIWGDGGVDTLNLASYSLSQLTFGTTGEWHVVTAKDGSFTNYLHSVERIITRNGTVSPEGIRGARAAADTADFRIVDDQGFDFSGFDMTPKPDPEFVEVEVSSTGEGPFYLISEQDVLDFGSLASTQADDTLIFYPDTPSAAAASADSMPFDSYAGSFDQTFYQHEIDQMSLYGMYTHQPIHYDMLLI